MLLAVTPACVACRAGTPGDRRRGKRPAARNVFYGWSPPMADWLRFALGTSARPARSSADNLQREANFG